MQSVISTRLFLAKFIVLFFYTLSYCFAQSSESSATTPDRRNPSSPTTHTSSSTLQTNERLIGDARQVHFIYMGGDDCPPCVAWRRYELPVLEKTDVFRKIKFSYVRKTIQSAVPSRFFLPAEVKPYKEKLDEASNERIGSPQFALLVNGEVYDYYFGTREATEVEKMLSAALTGGEYPRERCLTWKTRSVCKKAV